MSIIFSKGVSIKIIFLKHYSSPSVSADAEPQIWILVSLGVHGCKRTTVLCKVKERLNLNRSGTRKINDENKVPITDGAVGMKIKGHKRK